LYWVCCWRLTSSNVLFKSRKDWAFVSRKFTTSARIVSYEHVCNHNNCFKWFLWNYKVCFCTKHVVVFCFTKTDIVSWLRPSSYNNHEINRDVSIINYKLFNSRVLYWVLLMFRLLQYSNAKMTLYKYIYFTLLFVI